MSIKTYLCSTILYLPRYNHVVPSRTGKPGKMEEHFPVRENSGNFAKTGKVRQFYPEYWKNQKKLHWKFEKKKLEKSRKFIS